MRRAAAWAFTAPDPELAAEQVEVGELEGDRFCRSPSRGRARTVPADTCGHNLNGSENGCGAPIAYECTN